MFHVPIYIYNHIHTEIHTHTHTYHMSYPEKERNWVRIKKKYSWTFNVLKTKSCTLINAYLDNSNVPN